MCWRGVGLGAGFFVLFRNNWNKRDGWVSKPGRDGRERGRTCGGGWGAEGVR
jgi:hypothetical protein